MYEYLLKKKGSGKPVGMLEKVSGKGNFSKADINYLKGILGKGKVKRSDMDSALSLLGSESDQEKLGAFLKNVKGKIATAVSDEKTKQGEFDKAKTNWESKPWYQKLGSKIRGVFTKSDATDYKDAEKNYLAAQRKRSLLEDTHRDAAEQITNLAGNKAMQQKIKDINKEANDHRGLWAWLTGDKTQQQANIQKWKNKQMEELRKQSGGTLPNYESLAKTLNDTGLFTGSSFSAPRELVYMPSFNFSRSKLTEDQSSPMLSARRHAAEQNKNFASERDLVSNGRYAPIRRADAQYINDKTFYQKGVSLGGVPEGSIGKMPDGTTVLPEDLVNSYGRSHQGRYLADSWSPVLAYGAAELSKQFPIGKLIPQSAVAAYAARLSDNLGERIGTSLGVSAPGNVIASRLPEYFRAEAAMRKRRGTDYKVPSNLNELAYINLLAKARSGSPYWNDIKATVLPQFLGGIGESLQRTYRDLAAYNHIRNERRRAGLPY